jgi:hypothetical protein
MEGAHTMENDDSTPTIGAPYKDTPVAAQSVKRMPIRDPAAKTSRERREQSSAQDVHDTETYGTYGQRVTWNDARKRR